MDWSESGGERGRCFILFDNSMGKIVMFGSNLSKTERKKTVLVWCVFCVCMFLSFYVVFWPFSGLGLACSSSVGVAAVNSNYFYFTMA